MTEEEQARVDEALRYIRAADGTCKDLTEDSFVVHAKGSDEFDEEIYLNG